MKKMQNRSADRAAAAVTVFITEAGLRGTLPSQRIAARPSPYTGVRVTESDEALIPVEERASFTSGGSPSDAWAAQAGNRRVTNRHKYAIFMNK